MESLLLVVAILFLGGWVFGIAGFARAGAARREARALQAEVASLRGEVAGMAGAMVAAGFRPPEAAPMPSPAAAPPWAGAAARPVRESDLPPDAEPVAAQAPRAAPPLAGSASAPAATPDAEAAGNATARPPWTTAPPGRPRQSLEELITQRWGVWLGAGALMLAAVFLVRLAVEEGWLGPGLRSTAAALLGVALVVAGEWLARRPAKGEGLPDLAPAALAAGGVAALFGAAYAATVMYGLLPPLVGFVLMAAAGVFGLLLSLRRGKLVAVVGLAGAFVTPALVASDDPSLVGLFAYLLVVTAAAMVVVRVTAWGWLGWCAVVAGALWVLACSVVAAIQGQWAPATIETWAPAAFVPAAAAVFLLALPRAALATGLGRALAHVPPVALGLALLPVIVSQPDVAAPLGVLMLSVVAILAARRRDPELRRLPFIAAGLGLVVLLVWVVPAWSPTGEPITIEGAVQAIIPGAWVPEALVRFLVLCAAFALLHLLAGLALEARGGLAWAGLAVTVPVLTLLVAYARVRGLATDPTWALVACGLAAVHVGATARGLRAHDAGRAGAHAAGATAALALGVAMVLRDQWLTLAVAIFLPPLAMIAQRFALDPLRRVAAAVAAVVLVRLAANHFVLGYDWGGWPLLNGLLLAYGVPAACFWWASRIFLARSDGRVVRLLECGAALFATLLVLLQVRHALQDGVVGAPSWGFAEAAWQLTALFACAWAALLLHRRGGRVALLWAARAAGAVGLVLGAVLLASNPWMTNEIIRGPLLLNALLPAYALPALLVALAVARAPEVRVPQGLEKLLAVYALVSGFAWVTLEVRRAFHPTRIGTARITEAEMYAYSGAWLLLGALLLAVGIRTGRKEIRLAALGVIALVTLKVFLVDMDALVGLWRVLSFLGLGLALIALGAIYRRFVVVAGGTPAQGVAGAAPGAGVAEAEPRAGVAEAEPAAGVAEAEPADGAFGSTPGVGLPQAPPDDTPPGAAPQDGAAPDAPGGGPPVRPAGGAAPPA